jgi:hypothetical protein
MKIRNILAGAAIVALGTSASFAAGTYNLGDVIATFENATGNDLEIDLGSFSSLPLSGGVEDFGNVSSLLTAAGQTVSSTYFSVAAAIDQGSLRGGSTLQITTSSGTLTVLPNTLVYGQNNSSTPSFFGAASADGIPVVSAINSVGGDIQNDAAAGTSGLAASAVIVSALGDPESYTNQSNYASVSLNLETTGAGTLQLWLLSSATPGTSGKQGANQGPYTTAVELGFFSLSSSGELVGIFMPEPSTYALISGVVTRCRNAAFTETSRAFIRAKGSLSASRSLKRPPIVACAIIPEIEDSLCYK